MAETGFELHKMTQTHQFALDDRLDITDVSFVVFVLADQLQTIILSNHRPSVKLIGKPLGVFDDKLWFDGKQLEIGLSDFREVKLFVISAKAALTTAFIIQDSDYFEIGSKESAFVITQDSGEIIIHDQTLVLNELGLFTYYNNEKVTSPHTVKLIQTGDRILTNKFLLEKRANQWRITDFDNQLIFKQGHSLVQKMVSDFPQQFPKYRRSPRVYQEPIASKIKIEKIQAPLKESKNDLLRMVVPPLGMLVVTGLTSVLSGRNPIMMMGMGAMSGLTAVFTISQYFNDKSERVREENLRNKNYDVYLTNTVAEIARKYDEETNILKFKNPKPQAIMDMIDRLDSRIYERMVNNKDFLEISVGEGNQPSQLTIDSEINAKDTDQNTVQIKHIIQKYATQRQAPITLNLAGQTLGLIGTYSVLRTALINILTQIAFFHSYRDVNFVTVLPEQKYQNDWRFLRVLPHLNLHEIGFKGLIHDAQSRDVILNSFYQILTKRQQILNESGKDKPQFTPYYIFTVVDDALLAGHAINEFLSEDISELGVTVIWTKEDKKFLPDTITALIAYKNQGAGEIINDHNVYIAHQFDPYNEPQNVEQNLRKLANLEHVEIEKNGLPESLSLLDQYEVKTVNELQVVDRWRNADPSKSIRSLIGWRGQSEYLYWDLHERVHGPHALVGGTTGSGKSEFLTTYLIGLAINFSPEDIGMLIIDWKGGGIANTLSALPHFMGSITNLDGAGTARALASIKAELDKRMAEFSKYGVNNINAYMHLYKQRLTPKPDIKYPIKPIPHLILVSDEFAELKANVPEFLDELTSVARIGRSLGVHLILATQKPSGVVNDQIEANSTSKIALKMASEQDSNELLKTHDAAHITQPGRGYLKVGQNEVYELFQSGYAGAPYNPDVSENETIDERIYRVSDLGQTEIAYDPGEEVIQGPDMSDLPTQLAAVIDEVNKVAQSENVSLPDKPWLPNLEKEIVTPRVGQMSDTFNSEIPLGLLDIPSQQAQKSYNFNMLEMGHTIVFASPGYGKSTTLQTIVLNLSRQNGPNQVQFNLLDFGTNGLLSLQDLPHVIDIVSLEEKEKLRKMMSRISDEMDKRKALFKKYAVANLSQFETKSNIKLPVLINVLDSYDGLSQQDQRKDVIDNVLIQVLREGAALGIYLVMSASRVGAIRMNMMANVQTKVVLFLNDESEVMTIMGRDRVMQVAIPGRGQIIQDIPTAIQIFLPVYELPEANYLEALQHDVDELNNSWHGVRPPKIPMLPEELTMKAFEISPEIKAWYSEQRLPLGMSYETTDLRGFWSKHQPYFLFAPADDEQNLVYQNQLLNQLTKIATDVLIVDFNETFDEVMSKRKLTNNIHIISETDVAKEIINGIVAYMQLVKKHEQGVPTILVISDLQDFVQKTGIAATNLMSAFKTTFKSGLDIMVFSPHNYIAKSFDEVPKMMRQLKFTGLIGSRIYDSALVKSNGLSGETELNSWEAYYVTKGGSVHEKIKLPQDLIGEDDE